MNRFVGLAWPACLRTMRPALLLLASAAGCGRAEGPGVQIEGVVRLDGQPLPGGTVTFQSESGARLGIARIESDGRYRLGNANPGRNFKLPAGKYSATVLRMEIASDPAGPPAKLATPHRYADFAATPLRGFDLAAGANRLDLDLRR